MADILKANVGEIKEVQHSASTPTPIESFEAPNLNGFKALAKGMYENHKRVRAEEDKITMKNNQLSFENTMLELENLATNGISNYGIDFNEDDYVDTDHKSLLTKKRDEIVRRANSLSINAVTETERLHYENLKKGFVNNISTNTDKVLANVNSKKEAIVYDRLQRQRAESLENLMLQTKRSVMFGDAVSMQSTIDTASGIMKQLKMTPVQQTAYVREMGMFMVNGMIENELHSGLMKQMNKDPKDKTDYYQASVDNINRWIASDEIDGFLDTNFGKYAGEMKADVIKSFGGKSSFYAKGLGYKKENDKRILEVEKQQTREGDIHKALSRHIDINKEDVHAPDIKRFDNEAYLRMFGETYGIEELPTTPEEYESFYKTISDKGASLLPMGIHSSDMMKEKIKEYKTNHGEFAMSEFINDYVYSGQMENPYFVDLYKNSAKKFFKEAGYSTNEISVNFGELNASDEQKDIMNESMRLRDNGRSLMPKEFGTKMLGMIGTDFQISEGVTLADFVNNLDPYDKDQKELLTDVKRYTEDMLKGVVVKMVSEDGTSNVPEFVAGLSKKDALEDWLKSNGNKDNLIAELSRFVGNETTVNLQGAYLRKNKDTSLTPIPMEFKDYNFEVNAMNVIGAGKYKVKDTEAPLYSSMLDQRYFGISNEGGKFYPTFDGSKIVDENGKEVTIDPTIQYPAPAGTIRAITTGIADSIKGVDSIAGAHNYKVANGVFYSELDGIAGQEAPIVIEYDGDDVVSTIEAMKFAKENPDSIDWEEFYSRMRYINPTTDNGVE